MLSGGHGALGKTNLYVNVFNMCIDILYVHVYICIYHSFSKGGGHGAFGESDVLEQEMMEEVPNFHPYCVGNDTYLHVQGNLHQVHLYTEILSLISVNNGYFLSNFLLNI
jgi:hypothetical protein